jgi:hypothetical protein
MTELPQKMTKALPLEAAYPFGAQHGLQKEIDEIRNMEIEWDKQVDSSLRRGYIVRLFQSKGIFEEFCNKYWPNHETREGQTKTKWYLKNADEYDRFLGKEGAVDESRTEEEEEDSSFVLETHLRDFLAEHLDKLGNGLALYKDDRGSGVEYPVENGRIDILAVEPRGDLVVVELKVSQGRSKTLGQLLYYMGLVERNLARGRKVRGVIVAKEIPEDLRLACSRVPDVSLLEYGLQFSLRPAQSS